MCVWFVCIVVCDVVCVFGVVCVFRVFVWRCSLGCVCFACELLCDAVYFVFLSTCSVLVIVCVCSRFLLCLCVFCDLLCGVAFFVLFQFVCFLCA